MQMQPTEAVSAVLEAARREADARDPRPWAWVEASVWTERMLAALGNGVIGGKAQCLLRRTRAVHPARGLVCSAPIPMRTLPTGEPCAGEPLARFGGRGGHKSFPTPIERVLAADPPSVRGVPRFVALFTFSGVRRPVLRCAADG
jgi:hypothetical protein